MEAKPPEIHLDPEVEELWSSRALLLVLVLLILSFWVSYYLKIKRIKTIHETLVALFAGMVIGLIVRLSPGEVVQNMISFKSTIMLNVLLPPIILASGYDLKEENFFRNFGVILTFAFCGTFISAVVIGTLVYIWALLGFEGLSLGIIECLLFGSTLSATDPVTVLAIFNTLKVDPKLYSIIFGESLLNDAIAIVMFETLSHFHGEKISILSFFHGVGMFLLVFLTSMALGVVFGLACSLMLKHSRVSQFPEIESCLVLLIAYTSYFFSNASTMSGIVSLLFCGITLKHYAYHNMSRRTQRTTKYMFTTLSSLCENFIFIYLGLSLFTQTRLVYKPIFIVISALAVCVARYCAVFPISQLVNIFFRKARGTRSDELPHSYQMMLFWAGLRGAVGVALAAGIKGDNAVALRTTVLVTVVLTMVIFGGTTTSMIEIVGIRTGVEDEIESSEDEAIAISDHHPRDFLSLDRDDHRAGLYQDSSNRKTSLGDSLDQATSKHIRNSKLDYAVANPDDPYRRLSRSSRDFSKSGAISSPISERSIATQDSDDEVLPSADAQTTQFNLEDGQVRQANSTGDRNRKVWRDGQWFTVLDEHYLLPVFSNATASRKQASRKALRNQKVNLAGDGIYRGQSEGEPISSPHSAHPNSSWNSDDGHGGGSGGANRNRGGGHKYYNYDDSRHTLRKKISPSTPTVFQGSFSDALSALVQNPLSSTSAMGNSIFDRLKSNRLPHSSLKKKASDDRCNLLAENHSNKTLRSNSISNIGRANETDGNIGVGGSTVIDTHLNNFDQHPSGSNASHMNLSRPLTHTFTNREKESVDRALVGSTSSITSASNRILRSSLVQSGDYDQNNIGSSSGSCGSEEGESFNQQNHELVQSSSSPKPNPTSSLSNIHVRSHARCRSKDQVQPHLEVLNRDYPPSRNSNINHLAASPHTTILNYLSEDIEN